MYTIQLPWNDWKITKELGRGTSGTVYLAEKDIGGEKIQSAVKIIAIPPADSDEDGPETLQEIRIMEQLKGLSNIVSIEDVEMEGSAQSGWKVCIRMEYLQPFQEWKKRCLPQPVPEETIVRLGTDICKALEECEKLGIVHRDIKPSNIFVSANGYFKLGDFSISRRLDTKRAQQTNSGTALYIAPETERSCRYDARSDIYSLGLVLYELGNNNRMPFETTDQYSANRRRLSGEPIDKDPEMISNHLLAEAIRKAVRFNPDERFQNAAAFSRELSLSISGKRNAPKKLCKNQRTPVLRRVDGVETAPEQEKQLQAACYEYVSGTLNGEADFLRTAAEVLFSGEDYWPEALYAALRKNDQQYPCLDRCSFLKVCREAELFDSESTGDSLKKIITETEYFCPDGVKAALAGKLLAGGETEEETDKLTRILKRTPDDLMNELLMKLPRERLKDKGFVREVLSISDLACLLFLFKSIDQKTFNGHARSKFPNFDSFSDWFASFERNRKLRNLYGHSNKNNNVSSMNEANNILKPAFDLSIKLRNPETEGALAAFAAQTIHLEEKEDLGFYDLRELTGSDQDDCIQGILDSIKDFIGKEALLTPGYLFCSRQCAGLVYMLAVNQQNDREGDAETLKRDFQEMIQELPKVSSLLQLNSLSANSPLSAVLSQKQIRELCETHHILLDKTVLMSPDGRMMINELAGQLPKGRKLLVTTTTRYLLHPENSTAKNREGRAGYLQLKALQAAGKAAVIGKEPETDLADDMPAADEILRTNDRIRMCIITNDYSAAKKAIDIKKYPYLLICKLSAAVLPGEKTGVKAFSSCLPVKEKRIGITDTAAVREMKETASRGDIHPFISLGRNAGPEIKQTGDKPPISKAEQPVFKKDSPEIKISKRENGTVSNLMAQGKKDDQDKREKNDIPDKQRNDPESEKEKKASDEAENDITGKKVFDAAHGTVILKSKIAGGGEGTIWETDRENFLAKIYHLKYLSENPMIEKKLKAMAGHWPADFHICSPKGFLYDEMGQFRGFLMRRVPERFRELQKSVLKINLPRIQQKLFPDWHRKDLVQTAIAIALLLDKLHQKGFLMGDINPGNIMIDPGNPREVYLVDCDSYQFGEYPCPVGMEEYDHPRLLQYAKGGKLNYSEFYRKPEDEYYSFAVLAFQILFCGSYPFENKGSSSPQECKQKKEFMYGIEHRDIVFENDIIWQQLTKGIRTLFSDTFREWKTADMRKWADELKSYAYLIQKSQEGGAGRGFSNDLSPRKYREYDSETDHYRDGKCKACGREFNYARMYRGQEGKEKLFCFRCDPFVQSQMTLVCDRCGREFTGLLKQKILGRDGRKILCRDCQKLLFGNR